MRVARTRDTLIWWCPACPRREPADRNALRFLRCGTSLVAYERHGCSQLLGFLRPNFAAATGTSWARLAKIFQIAPLRMPEKAGDPSKLFIHFGVRVRIRVWQTRQAGLIATDASSTAAAPQSHIV